MKPLLYLFSALLALPLFSQAQSNYKPGYIVNLKGDTVKGEINYQEWNSNPLSIEFKSGSNGAPQIYKATDVNAFGVTGLENYVSYTGPVSIDPIDVDHVSSIRDTSVTERTAFFKVLQQGKNVALYVYSDNLKTRFYIAEAPGYAPTELIYHIYLNNGTTSGGRTIEENTYMKQLFALANKYGVLTSSLQWDIEHADYSRDGILKVTAQINHSSKADLEKTSSKAPTFNLVAGLGANILSYKIPSAAIFYAAGGRANSSVGPLASFGINIFANPNTQKLQFRVEGTFTTAQFKSTYESKLSPYIPMQASFDQQIIGVKAQIIYNVYNTEALKVFLGAGAVFDYLHYTNKYFGSQAQPNSATDIAQNNPYNFSSNDGSLLLKAGVQFSEHWGIYAEYQTAIKLENDAYWDMSATIAQAGVNYYFK